MDKLKRFLSGLAMFLSWLILPPLFFYLAKKWMNISAKDAFFRSFLSPIVLISFGYLLINADMIYMKNQYRTRYSISSVIGIKFPKYEELYRFSPEIDRGKPRSGMARNYGMNVQLKFTEDNDLEKFYREFETRRMETPNSISFSETGCSFTLIEDGVFFDLIVDKNDSTAFIRYGAW